MIIYGSWKETERTKAPKAEGAVKSSQQMSMEVPETEDWRMPGKSAKEAAGQGQGWDRGTGRLERRGAKSWEGSGVEETSKWVFCDEG